MLWGIVAAGAVVLKVAWTIGMMVAGVVMIAAGAIPAAIITRMHEERDPASRD